MAHCGEIIRLEPTSASPKVPTVNGKNEFLVEQPLYKVADRLRNF